MRDVNISPKNNR